jgi:hypothetical protein
MTEGVKRFNAELKEEVLPKKQLADALVKFIRAEAVGDLWATLKRNFVASKKPLLSATESLFLDFIREINKGDERWPALFSEIVE